MKPTISIEVNEADLRASTVTISGFTVDGASVEQQGFTSGGDYLYSVMLRTLAEVLARSLQSGTDFSCPGISLQQPARVSALNGVIE